MLQARVQEDPVNQRLESQHQRWGLTPRQKEVLRLVVEGDANKTIADELGISLRTVEFHVTSLLDKAGVDSRTRLIAAFWIRA